MHAPLPFFLLKFPDSSPKQLSYHPILDGSHRLPPPLYQTNPRAVNALRDFYTCVSESPSSAGTLLTCAPFITVPPHVFF